MRTHHFYMIAFSLIPALMANFELSNNKRHHAGKKANGNNAAAATAADATAADANCN